MKALSKERQRRYDSAIDLANDIERFAKDEPVTAGPPSAVLPAPQVRAPQPGEGRASSLVLLVLVGGVIGTTLGIVQARGDWPRGTGPTTS